MRGLAAILPRRSCGRARVRLTSSAKDRVFQSVPPRLFLYIMYGCSDWSGCCCDRPAVTYGAATFPLGNAASRSSSENDHAKHETNAGQRMDQSRLEKR